MLFRQSNIESNTKKKKYHVSYSSHNDDRFSKFQFAYGKYEQFNMSGLELTTVRDYAPFMALPANNQGTGGAEVEEAFRRAHTGAEGHLANDKMWINICKEQLAES